MLKYKVVETSVVTDEEIEQIVNEWVSRGWALDGVQFAMRESSKRPAMAFIFFTLGDEDDRQQDQTDGQDGNSACS